MKEYKVIFINGEPTKYVISSDGECVNTKTKKVIKSRIEKGTGRRYLSICHNGKVYSNLVSRWIAIAFIPIPEGYTLEELEADHIDGDPTNDTVSNIQWLTKYENLMKEHSSDGKSTRGESNGNCVITEQLARQIFSDLQKGIRPRTIRDKYGVSKNIVSNIKNGTAWKHLRDEFNTEDIKKFRPGGTELDDGTVDMIIIDLINKLDYTAVSNKYGVSKSIISDIVHQHSWTHVSCKYDLTKIPDARHNALWDKQDEVLHLLRTTKLTYRKIAEKVGVEFNPSINTTISALNKKYNCRSSTTTENAFSKAVERNTLMNENK